MKKPASTEKNQGSSREPSEAQVHALLARDSNVAMALNELENSFQELETLLAKINMFFQAGEMDGAQR